MTHQSRVSRRCWLLAGLLTCVLDVHAQYVVKPWPPKQGTPSIHLQDLAGKPVRLSDYKGRTVVLNFWASWCDPCRNEMPGLSQLQEIGGPELVVLAVNYKEGVPRIEQFARTSGLKMNWLRDADGSAAKALDVRTFPSTLIVGPQGQILRKVVGEVDWTTREAERLLQR